MPTDKFITLTPDKLSETIANLVIPVFTREKIWCQRLSQSGKYRGIKVCITAQNSSRVAYIIRQAKVYVERAKSLKDNKLAHTPKEELSTLFPE